MCLRADTSALLEVLAVRIRRYRSPQGHANERRQATSTTHLETTF